MDNQVSDKKPIVKKSAKVNIVTTPGNNNNNQANDEPSQDSKPQQTQNHPPPIAEEENEDDHDDSGPDDEEEEEEEMDEIHEEEVTSEEDEEVKVVKIVKKPPTKNTRKKGARRGKRKFQATPKRSYKKRKSNSTKVQSEDDHGFEDDQSMINFDLSGVIKNKIDFHSKEYTFNDDFSDSQPTKMGFSDLSEGLPNEGRSGYKDIVPLEKRRNSRGYFWIGTKQKRFTKRDGKEHLVPSYVVYPASIAVPFFGNPDLPNLIKSNALALIKDWKASNSSAKCQRSNHSRDIVIFADQCVENNEVTAMILTLSLYSFTNTEDAVKGRLPNLSDVNILFKIGTNNQEVLDFSSKENRLMVKQYGVEVCRRLRGYSGNLFSFLKFIAGKDFKELLNEAHEVLGITKMTYATESKKNENPQQ